MRAHTRRRARSRSTGQLGKPYGVFSERVQSVGPEHFGIIAVDPAKARCKWLMADFYGRVLVQPTTVEQNRDAFAKWSVSQLTSWSA